MMTKELHEKLTKYESIFNTAIKSKYYRAMDHRFAADFVSRCKEMNIYINVSCPNCVLRALQKLGQLYFDYQEPKPETPADDSSEPRTPTESPKDEDAAAGSSETIGTISCANTGIAAEIVMMANNALVQNVAPLELCFAS